MALQASVQCARVCSGIASHRMVARLAWRCYETRGQRGLVLQRSKQPLWWHHEILQCSVCAASTTTGDQTHEKQEANPRKQLLFALPTLEDLSRGASKGRHLSKHQEKDLPLQEARDRVSAVRG